MLDAIVERIPPPTGDPDAPPRALIFDSSYDQYRGVVAFVRVVDGAFRAARGAARDGARHAVRGAGDRRHSPGDDAGRGARRRARSATSITGLKDVSRAARRRHAHRRRAAGAPSRCPATRTSSRWCSPGLFPTDSDEYPELRDALEKLKLNDAALFYEPETSQALGFGFRCGFLGLLHMEIVRERLEREFDLDLLVTAPNVAYRVRAPNGEWVEVHTPSDMPDASRRGRGAVHQGVDHRPEGVRRRGDGAEQRAARHASTTWSTCSTERVHLTYELPLAEIVLDFYDQLKSRTRGYASFDYDLIGFRPGNLVSVDILVGGEPVDALSLIVHRDIAYDRGTAARREAARGDPAADVRRGDPGGDRLARDRARDGEGQAQGRDREVLRRRHHAASASCSRSRRRARSG